MQTDKQPHNLHQIWKRCKEIIQASKPKLSTATSLSTQCTSLLQPILCYIIPAVDVGSLHILWTQGPDVIIQFYFIVILKCLYQRFI